MFLSYIQKAVVYGAGYKIVACSQFQILKIMNFLIHTVYVSESV
jgi:hypothetical protein